MTRRISYLSLSVLSLDRLLRQYHDCSRSGDKFSPQRNHPDDNKPDMYLWRCRGGLSISAGPGGRRLGPDLRVGRPIYRVASRMFRAVLSSLLSRLTHNSVSVNGKVTGCVGWVGMEHGKWWRMKMIQRMPRFGWVFYTCILGSKAGPRTPPCHPLSANGPPRKTMASPLPLPVSTELSSE